MTGYVSQGIGMTLNGGLPLLPLGVERAIPNSPTLVTMVYNLFVIFIILVLATAASQRDAKFMAWLLPVWAGFSMFAGWLVYPDQGTGFGIIIICVMIATMTYMQETVHERFGIAGPGNKMIKIFTFIVLLQCVVVFTNSAAIFPALFPSTPAGVGATNDQYATIDLNAQMGAMSGSGGLLAQVVNVATITGQMAVAAILMMVKCIVAVAAFSIVLAQVFPWIMQAGAGGLAFLVVIQFAIWIIYLIFVVTVFYKPGPDPGW